MTQKAIEDRWAKHHGVGKAPTLDIEPNLPEPIDPETQMNKLEASFARDVLRPQEVMGEIRDWRYEPFKFILAHAVKGKRKTTTYTPDFLAVSKKFTMYEIKGFMRDDAMVKIKVAAELFPWFKWVLVTRKKGEWIFRGV